MVHDQHIISHGIYLSCCIFMHCPEPPMGICSVGLFPVQSGGSQTVFPGLLRVES